ncbi:sulfotransferase [Thalassotalea ponticola]|uniref:tetratricopeptide repeat-containing sulfotransferase family protein n=1 Tax=Thalassotalea ponticola TaxID=1523392 RepID=UPI0025B5CBFE|nr:tetratricopeptide repeat-containing sulfotransferase family protein [Thalassotalea ponticola]MDN3652265.1 sulfotransferase [Thalassotalea ponticola]
MTELNALYQKALTLVEQKQYQQAHHCLLTILKQDRQFARAYYLLAIIASDHHNVVKAIELAEKASQLSKQGAPLVLQAKLYLRLHDHVKAKYVAQQALTLAALTYAEWDDLGVVFSQMGDHFQAIRCFEQAEQALAKLPQTPQHAQLCVNLAAAYKFNGQFEQAIASYRRALAQDPKLYSAYWGLASMPESQLAGDIGRLTGYLQHATDADDTLYLAHSLSRQYEHQGDFAKAWQLLTKPKQRKKAQCGYHISRDQQLFSALKASFNKSSINLDSGCDSDEPIFIVGMPRTGTTVIERLLTQSNNIFSAGEMQHFAIALKQQTQVTSPALLDEATINAAHSIDWRQLGGNYLAKTRSITGHTPRFIDKMPTNFLYIGFILQALPKAKVICLQRSEQDTIISNYRQLFASDFWFYQYSYDINDCQSYYHLFTELMGYWQQLFANNIYCLNYESFVHNPAVEAPKLFDFIGETWQPLYLDLQHNRAPVATASAAQVRDGITAKSVGFWRHYQQQLTQALDAN